MGDFMDREEGTFTAGTLNQMFGPQSIAGTFAQIEELRDIFPNLLNPKNNATAREARKQTLRFAGFLITDELTFDGTYPAPKFKAWLKWLTWMDRVPGGTLILDNGYFGGTAGGLILEVLSQALPPGGQPSPVHFSWNHDNDIHNFNVTGTTRPGFSISVTSPRHSEVNANSDDEDDV